MVCVGLWWSVWSAVVGGGKLWLLFCSGLWMLMVAGGCQWCSVVVAGRLLWYVMVCGGQWLFMMVGDG